ncbi:TPA: hypothetical protein EYN98_02945 [Candidatus Poribacteria bacterium]|nr:hypothetical protein [Candidatus Poribacteria bacterium]
MKHEWEYVARGGLTGKRYSWGDNEDQARRYANYDGTGGKDKWTRCAPVDSFKSNRYGLFDITGNVYEWCADWYDEDHYGNSTLRNPQGPSSGVDRVLRGGSWPNISNFLRVACRFNFNPTKTVLIVPDIRKVEVAVGHAQVISTLSPYKYRLPVNPPRAAYSHSCFSGGVLD